TTSFGYADGEAGELTSITDPDANTTSFGYDGYGELLSVTDPTGGRTAFSYGCATGCYDNIGLVYASTTPSGQTTSYAYDGDGRVVSVTDPLGAVSSTSYDGDGNPLSVTDPDANVTVYAYNGDGEVTSVTSGYGSAAASTTTTGYDGDGEVVSRTDGNAATTNYAYNSVGELVDSTAPPTAADPNGIATDYGYDPAGALTSLTAADGAQTDYGYDPAGELTSVSYARDPAGNTSFGYDGDGRRTYMADASGTSSYAYDSLGELTSATDGAGHTVGYGYDAAGNLTSITYPGGGTVSRTFNADNQLASISDWLGNTSTFSYDADQNLSLIGYANGVSESYGYNAADQIISVADSYGSFSPDHRPVTVNLSAFAYTRDPNQQVTGTTSPGGAQPGAAYGYTPLNQLASATLQPPSSGAGTLSCGNPTICSILDAASTGNYSYDPAGNLTGLPGGATQSFDAADELLATTVGAVVTNYTYNQRGDRIAATTAAASVSYGYDQADQLTSYASSALAASYAYNGDGLRTSAAITLAGQTVAQTASYTYNLTSPVPEILGDGTNYYLYGPGGLPVEQIGPANTVSYLGHDQQGSTRILMSADKSIVGAYNYTPYGATISQAGATTPLQYDGAYHDPTGLYYLNARYYDPATGQFLTRDPLEALTDTPYAYAADNPLNFADPSGLFCGGPIFCPIVHVFIYHWRAILKYGGLTLAVVGAGASIVATGGLAAIPEGLAAEAGGVGTVAFVGSTAADIAQAAIDCRRNWRSLACAAGIAGSLVPFAAGKVTEQLVANVVGENVAKEIAGQAGRIVENNINTILNGIRARCGR
ncbi:MAG: RHS repeat-associated core domain-containing protein, partial [Mycobacteriales bacterium]